VSAAAAADGGQKLARIAREPDFAPHPYRLAPAFDFCYTLFMDDRHPDKKRARQDKRLDEALKETFPASDPVAVAPIDRPDPDVPPPKP
jgi:hypothetical protein